MNNGKYNKGIIFVYLLKHTNQINQLNSYLIINQNNIISQLFGIILSNDNTKLYGMTNNLIFLLILNDNSLIILHLFETGMNSIVRLMTSIGLIVNSMDTILYGTTSTGGNYNQGTLFQLQINQRNTMNINNRNLMNSVNSNEKNNRNVMNLQLIINSFTILYSFQTNNPLKLLILNEKSMIIYGITINNNNNININNNENIYSFNLNNNIFKTLFLFINSNKNNYNNNINGLIISNDKTMIYAINLMKGVIFSFSINNNLNILNGINNIIYI